MKRYIQALSFLLVLLVTVVGAQALTLRGTNGDASNFNELNFVHATGSFSFTTNASGDVSCTVHPEANYVSLTNQRQANNINLTMDGSQTYSESSVSVNDSITVPVRGQIPSSLPAVDTNLVERNFKVAEIRCSVDGTLQHVESVDMGRANKLELVRVNAEFGGNFGSIRRSGNTISDIQPGDLMSLEAELRNNFRTNDNVDFDINGLIVCDRDIFVDRDQDDMFLISGERDSLFFDLEFEEDDVRALTYTCTLSIDAEDDYGAKHGVEWDLRFEVHRENYELEVEQVQVSPSAITCTNREVSVNTFFKNIGSRNDRRVMLELEIPTLGITESFVDIDMDSTDRLRRNFNFRVSENAEPGSHEVVVRAYSRGTLVTDTRTATLTVPDCRPDSERDNDEEQDTTRESELEQQVKQLLQQQQALQQQLQQQQAQPNVTVDETASEEVTGMEGLYVALLVVLILVLLGGIAGLLVYLFKN